MTLLLRGSGFVDPHAHQRGASLAPSGMADLIPCIPLSARESATGNPLGIFLPLGQDFDEEELILEDNGCPGVHGARLHGPGRAEPYIVTRTGSKEAAVSPEQSPARAGVVDVVT